MEEEREDRLGTGRVRQHEGREKRDRLMQGKV